MSLHTRLRRLERRIAVDEVCPECRDRHGRTVLVVQMPDDSGVPEPEPCLACGAVPEAILHVTVTEVQASLLRAKRLPPGS